MEPPADESTEFRFGIDIDVHTDDEEVSAHHMRVKRIENLEKCSRLKKLSIVASCVENVQGLERNLELEELEIYQGLIREIRNVDHLVHLRVLDLSFNQIRKIVNIESLVNLEKLYLSNNQISEIEGLGTLTRLRVLELGSNRIRSLDAPCLENLVMLEELWLGKNKISSLKGDFSKYRFPQLKQLSLQSNRLTEWNPSLFSQVAPNIENAYFGSNQLPDMDADTMASLNHQTIQELDLSYNCLTVVPSFPLPLVHLQELWLNDNKIESTESLTQLCSTFPNLRTLYIERNPVQRSCPLDCKVTILKFAPPSLEQIDASRVPNHELSVEVHPSSESSFKSILKH
jgi:protein phosphatase 1 regulatory subunit 7